MLTSISCSKVFSLSCLGCAVLCLLAEFPCWLVDGLFITLVFWKVPCVMRVSVCVCLCVLK